MTNRIGYARVSTDKQKLSRQVDELKEAGCVKIFKDKVSGSRSNRKEFNKLVNFLRPGDIVVVTSLDRLGRSLTDLIKTANQLADKEVDILSLKQNIDTSSPTGKFFFHMFGALAEFELSWIRERTVQGLESARARGKLGGRPHALSSDKAAELKKIYDSDTEVSISSLCEMFQISRGTLYKYVGPSAIY